VARSVDLQRREAMVDRASDHLLERGRIDVSLRDLAAAMGASPRMLVHHFGSREALILRALDHARSRQREAFEARLRPQLDRPYAEVLADAWRWLSTEQALPYLRLFQQLHALARSGDGHADFARRSVLDWLPTVERGFATDGHPPQVARELATLTVAVVRGLLLDVNAVGDEARVSMAFDRYTALLRAWAMS
jgi:AcrR family transcriptional regulator